MIKIGIVGAGRLGGFHADKAAAQSDVSLVAVYDSNEQTSRQLAEKHKIHVCSSLEEMRKMADAVIVAVPTEWHASASLPFLEHGIHVLLEKPITASYSDAVKLVKAAEKSNAVLQVGHVEEFNPAWKLAESFLQPVKNGAPALFEAVRFSPYSFRSTDVGAVLDIMIHDIDLILSVVHSPVKSVQSFCLNRIGGYEDVARAAVTFENGSFASFFASRTESTAQRQMRVDTQDGCAIIDFASRTLKIVQSDSEIRSQKFAPKHVKPDEAAVLARSFMSEHFLTTEHSETAVDALALELDDFVSAITQKRQPIVSGTRAAKAIELAEKIILN